MIETNEEYIKAVAAGQWPADPAVPCEPAFEDDRGVISNLTLLDVGAVSEIRSRRHAVRANHWHKTDWHFAYVVAGAVYYFWRPVGSQEIPEPRLFVVGDLFFTPPELEHAMLFSDDSVILTWSKRRRDHESHEEDVVRVDFMNEEKVRRFLSSKAEQYRADASQR